jgi:tellurite methyltransferase
MSTIDPITGAILSRGYFYPRGPKPSVFRLIEQQPSGTALDLGAGFGDNATALLRSGYDVTATETNPECLRVLRKLDREYPGRIEVSDVAIQEYCPASKYDAVIALMLLHFLDPQEIEPAIALMQRHTKGGGYNLISCYTQENAMADMDPMFRSLVAVEDLADWYRGWNILEFEKARSPYRKYHLVRVLAKRPLT